MTGLLALRLAPWHLVERNVMWFRRSPLTLISASLEPFIFLFGLGVGLGQIVGEVEWNGETLTYAQFVAPALVATSAMTGAQFEMSFNFYFKLEEAGTFKAALYSPMRLVDIYNGELLWAMLRGGLYAVVYVLALWAFGLLASPWAFLIPFAALLVGLSFGCLASLGTTYVRHWQDFDLIFLISQPLFLLSTTFFSLDVYPEWSRPIVQATPLYHGVDLIRDLARGTVDGSAFGHVGYLVAMLVVTHRLTIRRLDRLLTN